jgi:hypothetical protein
VQRRNQATIPEIFHNKGIYRRLAGQNSRQFTQAKPESPHGVCPWTGPPRRANFTPKQTDFRTVCELVFGISPRSASLSCLLKPVHAVCEVWVKPATRHCLLCGNRLYSAFTQSGPFRTHSPRRGASKCARDWSQNHVAVLLLEFCEAKLHTWNTFTPVRGAGIRARDWRGGATAGGHAVTAQRDGTEPPQSPVFGAAENAPKCGLCFFAILRCLLRRMEFCLVQHELSNSLTESGAG